VKILFSLLFIVSALFSAEVKELLWKRGESFLTFLNAKNISQDLYFNLSKSDQELCSELTAGIKYQILYDDDDNILQVLIPISEEIQIHISKKDKKYAVDFVPIQFTEVTQTMSIPIKWSPYQDILDNTNNKLLANEFIRAFKRSVDFRKMRKGDNIAIKFTQRIRNGQYFGNPTIHAAMVEIRNRKHYIYMNDKDGRYYDEKARSLTSFFMKVPLRYRRISDPFTYKRWHPIKKRYRAHLGIDYAAPTGRKIFASADGKIIHRARKGGYGKTIIIRHKGNYRTLYAHMSRYRGGLKRGSWVKQGQHIGYVGSTGMSTGPHLHFGLYRNGRAINPNKIITITKEKLRGKAKKLFIASIKKLSQELLDTIDKEIQHLNIQPFVNKTDRKLTS